MTDKHRYLALTIFLLYTISVSVFSGYQYVGDLVEKVLNGSQMLSTFFVLPALLAMFRKVSLFNAKELMFLSWTYLTLGALSYIYPAIIYWEQGPLEFFDLIFWDAIVTGVVFVLIRKAAHVG
ncbi:MULTISPECIES: hypothetical protein [unclassified Vibrio]|uniref:hypothetical protein n=1 Tax=unclassified Vibrio TaxID=2614977 RepID=UPI001361626C|nr:MULTISPECIES: hypothetical protein [unclassified Vibrio]NAW60056.1 hypothetical protein [Vibrio sp. V36_P2S2PM302]NAX25988.1 hypothetical protein [Vibrio sp. V38_P2S17PM301]NAX30665.1 hypothetical protein [Vibrio sp. V37_P2S8PM304]